MTERKEYLGDGVYVDHDGVHIVLTTENGIEATNTIYLMADVYTQLQAWAERHCGI